MQIKTFSQKNLIFGALAGLFSGIILAFPLLRFESITTIGGLVGLSHVFSSLFFYLFLTTVLGVIFAVAVCKISKQPIKALFGGALYGVTLWIINLLMLITKMKAECSWDSHPTFLLSSPLLLGYIVFGMVLGFIYGWLRNHN